MDAVEFLTERERMCDSYPDCSGCGLLTDRCGCMGLTKETAKEAVAIVEQWSKEHPKKTRASEFLKVYPNAALNEIDGYPSIIPCALDPTLHKTSRCNEGCSECRRKYWTEEIE